MTSEPPVALRVRRLRPGARIPTRATPGSAGLDLCACLEAGTLLIGPTPVPVPTGIAIELPPHTEGQVRPRSSLSLRGVHVTFGTVDSDYRGEVLVTMYATGAGAGYIVHDGDRIAQLVVGRVAAVVVEEATELTPTERGAGGHGSTGR